MAVWPQNSIRPAAPFGHLRPPRTIVAPPKGEGRRGCPPRLIDRDGPGPGPNRLELLLRTPAADQSSRYRPTEIAFGRCFGPIRSPFVHEIRCSGCLQTVSGLLHSRSAFGIALPLTASDRRHLGCGCSSVVEHDLAKVGVEGSSPFARSRFSSSRKIPMEVWPLGPRLGAPQDGPAIMSSGYGRPGALRCRSSRR